MLKTDVLVLGGGIAGLSFASFVQRETLILERQNVVGGLSRSYSLNGIPYDIGPHIIFSKNKEVLDRHISLIETNRLRRSNRILYNGKYIKYPFENGIGALEPSERDYCLNEFLLNPYVNYRPQNMLQFFLSTFGEGITRTYLQPYNEKIWKFDPAFMDTQMVERIPQPPREDIIKSANGIDTEGYTHQLHFHYPKSGGFQQMVDAYRNQTLRRGQKIQIGACLRRIDRVGQGWIVGTDQGEVQANTIVNCMPLPELFKLILPPEEIRTRIDKLRFNSIYIIVVQVSKDLIGNHFGIYLPEKEIIFHRVSKLNFLGEAYSLPGGGSTLMAEVTFRPGSHLASLSEAQIVRSVTEDLARVGFIEECDILDIAVRREHYAYVIYDLDHRATVDTILGYLRGQGIHAVGRFAEFEYLNTDGVVERALRLAARFNDGEI